MTTDRDTLLTVATLLDQLGIDTPLAIAFARYGEVKIVVHLDAADMFTIAQASHIEPTFDQWNGRYAEHGFTTRGVRYFTLRTVDELSEAELSEARKGHR